MKADGSERKSPAGSPQWLPAALWGLAVVSLASHFAAIVFHLPHAVGGAMLSLSLLLLGLLHGRTLYGWRGSLYFIVISLGVSNAFENLSILTGFPFGWYHYTGLMGPKLFQVPLLIGPAYFGIGYLSWTLARLIAGDDDARLTGPRVVGIPVMAGFIMVAWDLTIDPMMSTIGGNWIWHSGGTYFGVPFVNFLGWYLTVYVYFQIFAIYARRYPAAPGSGATNWWQPLFAYLSIVIAPVLSLLLDSEGGTVTDPAGTVWRVRDIHEVTALVGLFTLLPFWLFAVFKVIQRERS
jgi:putative membrane protein